MLIREHFPPTRYAIVIPTLVFQFKGVQDLSWTGELLKTVEYSRREKSYFLKRSNEVKNRIFGAWLEYFLKKSKCAEVAQSLIL
ncbi:hypothetical protein THIOM_005569 [Candidatus Thiomargarita nelsonii]|uniref:Uncharacterized protein n=1 Tax=Candidatus Thiomargarita nelsonii TaxID=1003181 RepID=A0A176RSY0_9GAMM|nr:hypothetical protein THIOM_005569 [Candidatus Thiomargarita nelsonii]